MMFEMISMWSIDLNLQFTFPWLVVDQTKKYKSNYPFSATFGSSEKEDEQKRNKYSSLLIFED